ncbi:MAG: T9SS type A sorting domain-containing protein [Saprospiraceae bacterium]|nr:T9SS type A sorting domain-containing protein [Saprospiraceae bacterium]
MKLIFLFVFLTTSLFSQGKRDYIWVLGGTNSTTTTDSKFYRFSLDFNYSPLRMEHFGRYPRVHSNNASICDLSGQLLLHTSGCYVNDRLFRPMPNGKINEGYLWDISCTYGDYGLRQGSLILPRPKSPFEYIIIYFMNEKNSDTNIPGSIVISKLLYSIVNMNLNSGFGDVIQKNIPMVEKIMPSGYLTAVRHANNLDWWVISCGYTNNAYYLSLLDETGLKKGLEQNIGIATRYWDAGTGQSCFSPNGTMYAKMTSSDGLMLMDFDRESGLLSNFRQITTGNESSGAAQLTGLAFSSNSRFVYMFFLYELYQVDTWSQDPQASLVHIDSWDGYVEPGNWPAAFNLARLAPDCKIYVSTGTSNEVMHIIHEPNEKGKACRFEQHGLHLPAVNHGSIPNFVNYRLGYEPVCDSSLVSVFDHKTGIDGNLILWPNPASGTLYLELTDHNLGIRHFRIVDPAGKHIHSQYLNTSQNTIKIDISTLSNGLYFLMLSLENGHTQVEKIMVE